MQRTRVEVKGDIFHKDPFSSDLGRHVVGEGLRLLINLGFEQFTFKKLAQAIGCTESAIYRYFENKHKLLLYLHAWYWGYLEQNLVFAIANLDDAKKKLEIAVNILVNGPIFTKNDFIDPISLRQVLTDESSKALMTKAVDEEDQMGCFDCYYKLGDRIAGIIREINPAYPYPKTLVSTVMESSLTQSYYAKHLPGLTDGQVGEDARVGFFHDLVFKSIQNEN